MAFTFFIILTFILFVDLKYTNITNSKQLLKNTLTEITQLIKNFLYCLYTKKHHERSNRKETVPPKSFEKRSFGGFPDSYFTVVIKPSQLYFQPSQCNFSLGLYLPIKRVFEFEQFRFLLLY